jgi:outer membrane protein assembly factor BamD (BamD/ComL family)
MYKDFLRTLALTACLFCLTPPLTAATKIPKWEKSRQEFYTAEYHHKKAFEAYEKKEWGEAIKYFKALQLKFRDSPLNEDISYFKAISYFNKGEYDLANHSFTQYLSNPENVRFFSETIQYKFFIAEQLKNGAKCRLFDKNIMPKLADGYDRAIEIYDELIATLPTSALASEALFSKSQALVKKGEFQEAVECLKRVITTFPDEDIAVESYLHIAQIYCAQAKKEGQNPDFISLAKINVRNFEEHFPREARIESAKAALLALKEAYASSLFDTGCFYEKIGKLDASTLYYKKTLEQFPETAVSLLCKEKLQVLEPA